MAGNRFNAVNLRWTNLSGISKIANKGNKNISSSLEYIYKTRKRTYKFSVMALFP